MKRCGYAYSEHVKDAKNGKNGKMLENRLSELKPEFRAKIEKMLAELMRRRVYVVVIETARPLSRQQMLFDQGKTRTVYGSKHLYGEAVDLVPVLDFYSNKVKAVSWNASNPAWQQMDEVAKEVGGIAWGGDWTSFRDYPHFEWAKDDDK